jgi:hypothetical protein
MKFLKDNLDTLTGLGFGAAVPGLRDSVKNIVNNVTTSESDQKAKMQAMIDEDRAKQQKMMPERSQGRMRRQTAATDDGGYKGYKKGGKVVSSASKRADGCCVKGKTKGRMV